MQTVDSCFTDPHSKVQWTEVNALAMLCYRTSLSLRSNNMLAKYYSFPPDIMFTIPLLSALGPMSLRLDTYGLAVTFLQALYHSTEGKSVSTVASVLEEWSKPEILRLFGLEGDASTGRYRLPPAPAAHDMLSMLEGITKQLLLALSRSGHKNSKCSASKPKYRRY